MIGDSHELRDENDSLKDQIKKDKIEFNKQLGEL